MKCRLRHSKEIPNKFFKGVLFAILLSRIIKHFTLASLVRALLPGVIYLAQRKHGWVIFKLPMSSKFFISHYSKILDLQYNSICRSPSRFLTLCTYLKFPEL